MDHYYSFGIHFHQNPLSPIPRPPGTVGHIGDGNRVAGILGTLGGRPLSEVGSLPHAEPMLSVILFSALRVLNDCQNIIGIVPLPKDIVAKLTIL